MEGRKESQVSWKRPRTVGAVALLVLGATLALIEERPHAEIADALGTAEATVKNQASSIFSKLGVRDRTRAVLRAIELGVI